MVQTADVVVIGAGIAGSSIAYRLSSQVSVLLLECESHPDYHSTGRSAAVLSDVYGGPIVSKLCAASRVFLADPPEDFAAVPLLAPRQLLHVARPDQRQALNDAEPRFRSMLPSIRRLNKEAVLEIAPLIAPDYPEGGLLESEAMSIDVATLHQGYLKEIRRKGRLVTRAYTAHIAPDAGGWGIETAVGTFSAGCLVNAAGAWADKIAVLAGVDTIGLVPRRRTAALIDPPPDIRHTDLPMIVDIDERFYVKPEGPQLMISPADETPAVPSDAHPEDIDVALAVDRYERLSGRQVRNVRHSWAGLRSFVKDRNPVIGFSASHSGFFWAAALGGFGIMTSPAVSSLAAAMLLKNSLPTGLEGLAPHLSPYRFS